MCRFYIKCKNNLWYGFFNHFNPNLVTQAISTRFHGVSKAEFSSLNLALHNGDNSKDVWQNREAFCLGLGIDAKKIVTAQQVHGTNVLCVDESYLGRGAFDYEEAIENTDGLITNVPDLPLMMFFADCVPILIFDPIKKAIGICHAGWKGTVHRIAQKTVQAMGSSFNSRPEDCLIGIGPSIGPCCFEVDEPVYTQFKQAFPSLTCKQTSKEKWKINLWEANRLQLKNIGVLDKNIICSNVCTKCNSDVFFSYRADEGKTGRIAAIIQLKS
ncbi:peptidoglycan editing factor PgeF [Anaerosinus sp.]|uniref:peptidoglycan editing factor PgeF n=1 Tax=Selenobaculum sp. TaxID=3074374 RepID=UPI003AB44593